MDYKDLIEHLETILEDIRTETGYLQDIDYKVDKNNIMITCPEHAHGRESHPSCGVDRRTGKVHCLTCGYRGNLISLSKSCRGESNGFEYLINRYVGKTEAGFTFRTFKPPIVEEEEPIVEIPIYPSISAFKEAEEYLLGRGISLEIQRKFDIKYSPERKMVMIPIKIGDEIVGYKGRKIVKCDKKYRFYNTPNMKKPLFCLDKVEKGTAVFITEAEIDCLTLWSWGLEAISILGSHITPLQLEQLKHSNITRVIIALDNDYIGRESTKRLLEDLKELNIEIQVLTYKPNTKEKDANDFNSLEEYKAAVTILNYKSILTKLKLNTN